MSEDKFIEKEQTKIANILAGLDNEELSEIQPQITFINYLLDQLKTGNISKKEKKKIEKKIDKTTDDLEDDKKEDDKNDKEKLIESLSAYTLTKNIKPNITEIPEEDIIKAKMAKASSIAYDTNYEQAQQYLDQNDIPYTIDQELSNKEGLVLHNPLENDTKIAYRGTKFSSIEDLRLDGQILTGLEKSHPQVVEAISQANQTELKYGTPSETVGYSKGGFLGIHVADNTNIPKSTTFNSFLGSNALSDSSSKAQHTLYRTTEDIPSIAVGFKKDLDNYKVSTIRPKIDSLDPRKAHDLNNFLSNKDKRATRSTLEELSNNSLLDSQRISDATTILHAKNFLNDKPNILDKNNLSGIQDSVSTDEGNLIGPRTDKILNNPYNKKPITPADFDFMEYNLNVNYPTKTELLGYPVDEFAEHGPISVNNGGIFDVDDAEKFLDDYNFDGTPKVADEPAFNIKDLEHRFLQLGGNLDPDPVEEVEMPEITGRKLPVSIPMGADTPPEPPKNKSFSKWIDDFNDNRGSDTLLTEDGDIHITGNRFTRNSPHTKFWEELGGKFNDQELSHFATQETQEETKMHLSDSERNELYNANETEENNIMSKLTDNHLKSIDAMNDYTSIPNEAGTETRSMTNDLIRAVHPMNLGIGMASGWTASKTVDFFDDPKTSTLNPNLRSGIVGSLAGAQASSALLGFAGESITLAAVAPEIIAGGLGSAAATKTYSELRKSGVDDNSATVTSGAVGGAVTGLASAAAGAAIGGELGAPEAGFTFGLSVIAGATLGAIVGEGGYLYKQATS